MNDDHNHDDNTLLQLAIALVTTLIIGIALIYIGLS